MLGRSRVLDGGSRRLAPRLDGLAALRRKVRLRGLEPEPTLTTKYNESMLRSHDARSLQAERATHGERRRKRMRRSDVSLTTGGIAAVQPRLIA